MAVEEHDKAESKQQDKIRKWFDLATIRGWIETGGAFVAVVGAAVGVFLQLSPVNSSTMAQAGNTVITTGAGSIIGNDNTVTLNITGFTVEQHEKRLEKREAELQAQFSHAANKSGAARAALEKQLKAVREQLTNATESHKQRVAELERSAKELAKLRNQVPDEQVRQAVEALERGDTDVANAVIAEAKAQPLLVANTVRAAVSQGSFVDEFDGNELGAHWEVLNPDRESYIVENGALTIISHALGGLTERKSPNTFKLNRQLPAGDWTAEIVFRAELQTGYNTLQLGLYDGVKNMIVGSFWGRMDDDSGAGEKNGFYLSVNKKTDKASSNFQNHFIRLNQIKNYNWQTRARFYHKQAEKFASHDITMTLIKKGRSYWVSIGIPDDKSTRSIYFHTDKVSSLRPPKSIVINASSWGKTSGEDLYTLKSIRIEPASD